MKIKVLRPLAGAVMMVQRGRSELLPPTVFSPDHTVFDFKITVDLSGPEPNFLGKYSQGPKTQRFVYVNSGSYAGQCGTHWNRRAKISLMSITREQIELALRDGASLVTEFEGVGREGGPACASVMGTAWRVEQRS
jgi:hypothetical protein